jgi:hypothetical protein
LVFACAIPSLGDGLDAVAGLGGFGVLARKRLRMA